MKDAAPLPVDSAFGMPRNVGGGGGRFRRNPEPTGQELGKEYTDAATCRGPTGRSAACAIDRSHLVRVMPFSSAADDVALRSRRIWSVPPTKPRDVTALYRGKPACDPLA